MKIAVGIIVAFAAIGIVQNLAEIPTPSSADLLSASTRAFEPLRRSVPPTGPLGYITDRDQATEAGNVARLRAQYSLAPHVLVPPIPFRRNLLDPAARNDFHETVSAAVTPEWFVGDFADPATAPAIVQREHLAIMRDFGNGILLLRLQAQ